MTAGVSLDADLALRRHVHALLSERQAHLMLDDVLEGFPLAKVNERLAGVPYSAWELLWHLRFAQRDILNFVREGSYRLVPWPDGYWPPLSAATPQDWAEQVAAFRADFADLLALLDDPGVNLLAPVPNGTGQTWLREFLLVADHNAYHVGQLALLRRLLAPDSD